MSVRLTDDELATLGFQTSGSGGLLQERIERVIARRVADAEQRALRDFADHKALLLLLLENVHVGVSNDDIVIDTQRFDAPGHLRTALVDLMDEVIS